MTALPERLRVLVVEDDPGDALLIRESLAESKGTSFEVFDARTLADGLAFLEREAADVVLLDLGLPDSFGMQTLETLRECALGVPVVVLSGLDDEDVAATAVNRGAQEYFVKGEVSGPLLARSIRHAVERHALQEQLRSLATSDELTGLHNRRGFKALAEQELKRAARTARSVVVLYIDLDGMKTINDTLRHAAGDRALRDTAGILLTVFRGADIVARVGGDEFCVMLSSETDDDGTVTTARLQAAVAAHNERSDAPFDLSLSVGVEIPAPGGRVSLDEMLDRADARMYESKRAVGASAGRPTPTARVRPSASPPSSVGTEAT